MSETKRKARIAAIGKRQKERTMRQYVNPLTHPNCVRPKLAGEWAKDIIKKAKPRGYQVAQQRAWEAALLATDAGAAELPPPEPLPAGEPESGRDLGGVEGDAGGAHVSARIATAVGVQPQP